MSAASVHMPLLRTKVRHLLEKGVKEGIPPAAAGACMGIAPRHIQLYMACGMRCMDERPVKPEKPEEMTEFPGKRFIKNSDWYAHELECLAFARMVMSCEGMMVGKLVKRMWKNSAKNPEMMKFLFKHYSHVHALAESKSGASIEIKSGDGDDLGSNAPSGGLLLYLPHNGREEPVMEPVKKPSPKAGSKK